MKFACDACGKKYVLTDEKLAGKRTVKLKCRACAHVIVVKQDGELVISPIVGQSVRPAASLAPDPLPSEVPRAPALPIIDEAAPGPSPAQPAAADTAGTGASEARAADGDKSAEPGAAEETPAASIEPAPSPDVTGGGFPESPAGAMPVVPPPPSPVGAEGEAKPAGLARPAVAAKALGAEKKRPPVAIVAVALAVALIVVILIAKC
jgi:predicted Zn finger-like uncharacterized protein